MSNAPHAPAPRSCTLVRIHADDAGVACQACGRELSARMFDVRVTATGAQLTLGRRCAARATGYPTTRLEHEARRLELLREQDRQLAAGTVDQYAAHLRRINVLDAAGRMCVWTPDAGEVWLPVDEVAVEGHARLAARLAAGDLD